MPTLIVLIGPTGVGKTELSLRLVRQLRLPTNSNVSPINWSARSTSQTITALPNTKQKHWKFWRNYSRNTKS